MFQNRRLTGGSNTNGSASTQRWKVTYSVMVVDDVDDGNKDGDGDSDDESINFVSDVHM